MGKQITESKTIPLQGGVDLVHEKALLPSGSLSQVQNMRPRRPGFEKRKGHIKQHTTAADSQETMSLLSFSKGSKVEVSLFRQLANGAIHKATNNPPTVTTGNFGTQVFATRQSGPLSVTSITRSGTTATVTVTAHGYDTGKVIRIFGANQSEYNIVASIIVLTTDTFTYEVSGSPATPATGTITAGGEVSPATWGTINDHLVLADGAGLPVIYPGQNQRIGALIVYKGSAAIPAIPMEGSDYSMEAIDSNASTTAILSSLSTLAAYDCVFILAATKINKLNFTVVNANGTTSTAEMAYRTTGGSWANVSGLSDSTVVSGASLGQSGSISWTSPTDESSHFQFNMAGFWYRLSFSVALDSSVSVSSVTCDGPFQEIENIWSGELNDAAEVQIFDDSADTYLTYAGNSISAGGITATDELYFCSAEPIYGIFLDVGATPNTTASTNISSISLWDGTAFTGVSGIDDGTKGIGGTIAGAMSGYITWTKSLTPRKSNFRSSIYGYWYKIMFSQTLPASLVWGISVLPYIDIKEIGSKAQSCAAWKDRVAYCFNDNYIHFSALYAPMVLNGTGYGLIAAGDGRSNKVLAMRRFYNELFVWQEEKGKEGGCLTIIEGNSPETFDKLVLSDRIGIMNAKSVTLLEDSDVEDMVPNKGVYKSIVWLSRYGVYKTDGRNVKNISGGIGNYFDPTKSECIRVGYESKHWLQLDPTYNVVRVGLVSGATATLPNVFLVYDVATGNWSTDTLGQPLSCIEEVEAVGGAVPVVQMGGGQDGFVYIVNTTDSDVSTAIDGSVTMELNGQGRRITLKEEALRCKVQSAGDITRTIAINGNTTFGDSKAFTMTTAVSGDTYRRHRSVLDKTGDHLSIKWRNNTAGQSMSLLDIGVTINEIETNT